MMHLPVTNRLLIVSNIGVSDRLSVKVTRVVTGTSMVWDVYTGPLMLDVMTFSSPCTSLISFHIMYDLFIFEWCGPNELYRPTSM